MTTLDELDKAIKSWISLKCLHCGELNPIDTLRCIYCGHLIRKHAVGGQHEQGRN